MCSKYMVYVYSIASLFFNLVYFPALILPKCMPTERFVYFSGKNFRGVAFAENRPQVGILPLRFDFLLVVSL